MQTFLPLPDYKESMKCLDVTRLGNQVWREGMTLIRGGWPNHPASKMWRGHEYHLGLYLLAGLEVLRERSGKKYLDLEYKIKSEMARFKDTGAPPWFGDEEFHASHRSNLLRKANEALEKSMFAESAKKLMKYISIYQWYQQFEWTEPSDLPYVWPINKK